MSLVLIAKIGPHYGGAVIPYEDFTTFTEVDDFDDITVAQYIMNWETMIRTAGSHVYKDYGANYFADFEIQFEAEATLQENLVSTIIFALTGSTIGSWQDFIDANEGMSVHVNNTAGIKLQEYSLDNSDEYGSDSTGTLYYYTVTRVGTTLTCYIYSDAARTVLVDTLTCTGVASLYRYLYILAARDAALSSVSSGYVQNLDINPNDYQELYNITSVDPSGDFTISQFKIDVSTMQREDAAYNYIDFDTGYFGNFDIEFEAEVTNIASLANLNFIGVTNTIGTRNDHLSAVDGMCCQLYGGGGVGARFQLQEDILSNNDLYNPGGSSVPKYYFKFYRSGTTLTCDIYSDAARTVLVDSLSCTCTSAATRSFRYLHVAYSREIAGDTVTGYVQNVKIITAS